MNKKIASKIITAVIIGAIAISSYTLVFAEGSTNSTSDNGQKIVNQKDKGGRVHASKVGDGKLNNGFKTQLDSLVSSGTISQDQEDKIISYFKEKQTEMKAEMDKVKAMNEADRKAYMEQKRAEMKSGTKMEPFKDLVAQNIITQDQADAIKKLFPMHKTFNKDAGKEHKSFDKQLSDLVTAGTISDEQKGKITSYLEQKKTEMKAEMDKIKAMSKDERKAYMEQKKAEKKAGQKTNILSELVAQNIITQDQADAIAKLFPVHKNK